MAHQVKEFPGASEDQGLVPNLAVYNHIWLQPQEIWRLWPPKVPSLSSTHPHADIHAYI